MPGSEKQNSMFKKTRGYVQEGNPLAVTSCGRRRNDGDSSSGGDRRSSSSKSKSGHNSFFGKSGNDKFKNAKY